MTVFTHTPGTKSPQIIEMAEKTKCRAYGPVEANPNQLPQIFIKEATVVRRSLIMEDRNGIPVKINQGSTSEMIKGLSELPDIYGLVLTSNSEMLKLMRKLGFSVKRFDEDPDFKLVTYVL